MNQEIDDFCKRIKKAYPSISEKTDQEYSRLYDDFNDEEFYSYTWFDTLANAINNEMANGVSPSIYSKLFIDISQEFEVGSEEIKKCIDVAFVENLFWKITPKKAQSYWSIFPDNLKKLYIDFHRKTPI